MRNMVIAVSIATATIGTVGVAAAEVYSFDEEFETPTIEECEAVAEVDHIPQLPAIQLVDVTAEPGGGQIRTMIATYQGLEDFVTQATDNLLLFVDKWAVYVEGTEEGGWRLKDGAMKAFAADAATEYDCIITAAEVFIDEVAREDVNRAVVGGILVASELVDFFQNLEATADAEYDKVRFRNLKMRTMESLDKFEFLQERLRREIGHLQEIVRSYKKDRTIAVWSYVVGEVEDATNQLEKIVESISVFRELIAERRRVLGQSL